MESKKEEITTNDLAVMIKKGFDHVDERFEKIDERFGKIDGRFEEMEEKIDNLEATLLNQYPDKNYLSDKLGDLAAEIGARIERKKEQDRKFKEKVIEILKRNSLAEEDEILFLKKLV